MLTLASRGVPEDVVMSLPVLAVMTALVLCRATFYFPDTSDKLKHLQFFSFTLAQREKHF